MVADALHAGVVPAVLVSLPGRLILRHPVQPHAAGLVIDAAGPGARGRVDLELVPVHETAGVVLMAPQLHAGIDAFRQEVELQDEVAVLLGGGQEGVHLAVGGGAHDHAVLGGIFRRSGHLFPALEVPAIEQGFPLLGVREGRREGETQDQC